MNVRISAEGIRFRISTEELKKLLNGGSIIETVALPQGSTITLGVDVSGDEALGQALLLMARPNEIRLGVSQSQLEKLMVPSKRGLAGESVEGRKVIRYSLEVDLRG